MDPDVLDIFIDNFDKILEIRGDIEASLGGLLEDIAFSQGDKAGGR